jgi:hypothetical protein
MTSLYELPPEFPPLDMLCEPEAVSRRCSGDVFTADRCGEARAQLKDAFPSEILRNNSVSLSQNELATVVLGALLHGSALLDLTGDIHLASKVCVVFIEGARGNEVVAAGRKVVGSKPHAVNDFFSRFTQSFRPHYRLGFTELTEMSTSGGEGDACGGFHPRWSDKDLKLVAHPGQEGRSCRTPVSGATVLLRASAPCSCRSE